MILFGFIEDMRSLDDKKVSQVSQFVEMTSRTGFHLVMIIPFNYTPDLCVIGVIFRIKYKANKMLFRFR